MRKVLLYCDTECIESGTANTMQGAKKLLQTWKRKYHINRLDELIIIQ